MQRANSVAIGLALLPFLAAVALARNWFDADEFVNLQQAIAVHQGLPLYTAVPSNHPPGYTWGLAILVALLPKATLVGARLLGAVMGWTAGVLLWDLYRREGHAREGRLFLALWSLDAFVLLAATRAMNEAPLLMLAAAAFWLVARRAAPSNAEAFAAGLLLGAAVMVRYTALFYAAPVLFTARRRVAAMAGGGFLALTIGALAFSQAGGDFGALYGDTVAFHGGRSAAPLVERLLTTLVWAGWPLALYGLWQGILRRPVGRFGLAAAVALGSASVMFVLPNTHAHYFLAVAPVAAAVTAALMTRDPAPGQQAQAWSRPLAVAALFAVLTVGQAAGYVLMTPHNDLGQAKRVAAWVGGHSAEGDLVLTDAPEYAVLAGRGNWGNYYWALRSQWTAQQLEPALDAVPFIVASSRFGSHVDDFPGAFEDRLARLPCAQMEGGWVFWNTELAPAPDGFGPPCPAGLFDAERGP